MDKKTNDNNIEREYIIPLRRRWKIVPRYKRANKAIKTIKEFLVRHMKIRDRDLKKVRIDKYLNEAIWNRGIKNPPSKIKVKAIKENDIVRVELVEFSERLKFKKLKEEKREKKAKEAGKKKKAEEKKEEVGKVKTEEVKKIETQETEKKEEEKEKMAATVEAGKEMEKTAARQMKHEQKRKVKEPKRQRRMALQK